MKKVILETLLKDKPADTRRKVGGSFAATRSNFEFAASVSMTVTQQRMDEASSRGFVVWCNKDARSAIMYGAGNVSAERFTDCLGWLKEIGVKGEIVMVHFEGRDGDKLVNIQN
jgi:hypothetical protein